MRYLNLSIIITLLLTLNMNARTWTGKNGKAVEGDFIKLIENKVHVKNSKGKIWKISVNNLIPSDVAYAEKMEDKRIDKKVDDSIKFMSKVSGITKEDLIITAVFHVFVIFLLFKLIFGNFASFMEACKYGLKPDWISWWQGDGWADFWNEAKLKIFIFLIFALYGLELVMYRMYIKDMA